MSKTSQSRRVRFQRRTLVLYSVNRFQPDMLIYSKLSVKGESLRQQPKNQLWGASGPLPGESREFGIFSISRGNNGVVRDGLIQTLTYAGFTEWRKSDVEKSVITARTPSTTPTTSASRRHYTVKLEFDCAPDLSVTVMNATIRAALSMFGSNRDRSGERIVPVSFEVTDNGLVHP